MTTDRQVLQKGWALKVPTRTTRFPAAFGFSPQMKQPIAGETMFARILSLWD